MEDDLATEVANRWKGLMRTSILTTSTIKLYNYTQLADQKAMGLIVLNSIIIPIAMNRLDDPDFTVASTVAIVTGMVSIFMAIMCIFPKRSRMPKADGSRNLLHYSDIGKMSEQEYLDTMLPIYNDKSALAVEVLKDMHDVSRRVLIPKFRLLKFSYSVFFLGNLAAVLVFLAKFWG